MYIRVNIAGEYVDIYHQDISFFRWYLTKYSRCNDTLIYSDNGFMWLSELEKVQNTHKEIFVNEWIELLRDKSNYHYINDNLSIFITV